MATPHISAEKEDIANIVIMPGDPNRVKYIVDNFLDDYKLVNEVRGELGYTGYYKGKKVTVFSSGMGIPSMGIYSHELFSYYDVDVILRIGSAGSYSKELNVNDLFLVDSTYSESRYGFYYSNSTDETVCSSKEINELILNTSKELSINLKSGRCHSTEVFYTNNFDMISVRDDKKCQCVEMETYSLFTNASYLKRKASCILTISDSFITGEALSSEEREKNFNDMIILALESAYKM